ncbi:hypothetical protein [Marinobacterium marinum]|uniref:Uncharacterized protein n=1 Tax=Marinobacterium marinum TaxID=2756129 RepID=A0A7W1WZX3_9GAMM|nr:hypothetical protein [Marinobacterium marinum]MBA4503282.1 hypothetical protein [Marinobacterium marinum]
MSKSQPKNRTQTMYPVLPLMLLGLVLLVGQLSVQAGGHTMAPSSLLSSHEMPCVSADGNCHAQMPDDCCADSAATCVIKCALGTAWIGIAPVQVTLAQVRALPPPVSQRLTDHPPEPPYQPPRLSRVA